MMTFNQHIQDMTATMNEISESSNEISKIIAAIENITFQTNILTLYAAVEAARAGTAGKGFAVVADEVRNLANKSQEVSKNTADLIRRSIEAVENETQIAAQTLLTTVEGVKDVTASIDQISRTSETQANSIEQVTLGVNQSFNVVQNNSATAEESAAASEEFRGQSQMLKNAVAQFMLKRLAKFDLEIIHL